MDKISPKADMEESAAERKRKLRRELKKRRKSLTEEYKKDADRQILRNLISLSEYRNAKTVFCYVGTEEEINTRPVLERILSDGKRLGVPRCIGKGIMEVRMVSYLDQLKPGMYGILEPAEFCVQIPPEEIDLAFVPCLSCSRDGRRLGYGGGYYDRYLTQTTCGKIALCQEKMLEDEIPVREWDLRMDKVITEKRIYNVHRPITIPECAF